DDNYIWTSADYKRTSVISPLDFIRVGYMKQFEDQLVYNSRNGVGDSHMISREDYALHIRESFRGVVLPNPAEALKKKKKKMEGQGGGECESEKKKGCDGESSNNNDKLSNKNKLYKDLKETIKWLREIYDKYGPDEAEAIAKARNEADHAAEAVEAAAKALNEAKEAAQATAKALNEALEAAAAAAKAKQAAAKALNDALLV
ncbi:hypothetical protein Tco_1426539, partial [Tanacetum coccineum]